MRVDVRPSERHAEPAREEGTEAENDRTHGRGAGEAHRVRTPTEDRARPRETGADHPGGRGWDGKHGDRPQIRLWRGDGGEVASTLPPTSHGRTPRRTACWRASYGQRCAGRGGSCQDP